MTFTAPITNTDLKYYLRITTSDATFNSFLDTLINAATERACRYCHQDFGTGAAQIEIYEGEDRKYLNLPWVWLPSNQPLQVTLTAINEQEMGSATAAVAITTECRTQVGTRYVYRDGIFKRGWIYKVTYTNAAFAVPQLVKTAITKLAAHYFMQSRQGFGALGRKTDYSNVVGQSQTIYEDPEQKILSMLEDFIYRPQ